eukprot:CAMPEP_0168309708 /NCGR_PEP_ID=MMETSP0142_2-20121227/66420_1 /TAXON_ID=44445 /ORGANISM="Pseudo-nitzschia australis, Strain 10249 10 AB" /LENGTH=302 /DNA_ID=CAMNT_0008262447 /DNA_START=104 /DNA_END=1012 /DNA_ORIENTATION=-
MTQSSSFTFLLAVFVLAQLAIGVNAQPGQGFTGGKIIDVFRWVVPYEGPKEFAANVGDTIVFRWIQGAHNVYIHPSMSCDMTGAIMVGQSPGTEYTFIPADGGTDMFFSCDIGMGSHCVAGQSIIVTVADASATEAPTVWETSDSSFVSSNEVDSSPPRNTTEVPVVDVPAVTEAPSNATDVPFDAFDTTEVPVVDVPAVTEAPSNATDVPFDAFDAPSNTTEAPVVETDAPVVATDAPVVATDAPVAATEAPVAATEAPVAATDASIATALTGNMSSPASGTYFNVMSLSLVAACLALVFV